jgi:NADH-quinone oxidoreductase subunit L
MFLTFYGEPRGNRHTHEHAHESPWTMLVPLGVLGLGAVFAGMVWYGSFFGKTNEVAAFFGVPYAVEEDHAEGDSTAPEAHGEESAYAAEEPHYVFTGEPGEGAIHHAPGNNVLNDAHVVPNWVRVAPFAAMVLGFLTALWFYILNPAVPGQLAKSQRPLYQFLLNKWYFDEAYDFLFVRPARRIGRFFWKGGDGATIDGGINGLAMGIIPFFTRLAGRAQSGYIFHYAFAMVIGIVVLITWVALRAAG